MSLRQVLTIYNAERQLNDDETALLNTLRRMSDAERELVSQSLSDKPQKKSSKKSLAVAREYDHCLRCGTTKRDTSHKDQSSPDYHEFQSSKDIDFCARCKAASENHPVHHEQKFGGYHPFESSRKPSATASKSRRASGMAEQLSSRRQAQAAPKPGNDNEVEYDGCVHRTDRGVCLKPADHNIHHLNTYEDYHLFQSGAAESTVAAAGD